MTVEGKPYCGIHGRQRHGTDVFKPTPVQDPSIFFPKAAPYDHNTRNDEPVKAFYQPDIMSRGPVKQPNVPMARPLYSSSRTYDYHQTSANAPMSPGGGSHSFYQQTDSLKPVAYGARAASPISPSMRGVPTRPVMYGADLPMGKAADYTTAPPPPPQRATADDPSLSTAAESGKQRPQQRHPKRLVRKWPPPENPAQQTRMYWALPSTMSRHCWREENPDSRVSESCQSKQLGLKMSTSLEDSGVDISRQKQLLSTNTLASVGLKQDVSAEEGTEISVIAVQDDTSTAGQNPLEIRQIVASSKEEAQMNVSQPCNIAASESDQVGNKAPISEIDQKSEEICKPAFGCVSANQQRPFSSVEFKPVHDTENQTKNSTEQKNEIFISQRSITKNLTVCDSHIDHSDVKSVPSVDRNADEDQKCDSMTDQNCASVIATNVLLHADYETDLSLTKKHVDSINVEFNQVTDQMPTQVKDDVLQNEEVTEIGLLPVEIGGETDFVPQTSNAPQVLLCDSVNGYLQTMADNLVNQCCNESVQITYNTRKEAEFGDNLFIEHLHSVIDSASIVEEFGVNCKVQRESLSAVEPIKPDQDIPSEACITLARYDYITPIFELDPDCELDPTPTPAGSQMLEDNPNIGLNLLGEQLNVIAELLSDEPNDVDELECKQSNNGTELANEQTDHGAELVNNSSNQPKERPPENICDVKQLQRDSPYNVVGQGNNEPNDVAELDAGKLNDEELSHLEQKHNGKANQKTDSVPEEVKNEPELSCGELNTVSEAVGKYSDAALEQPSEEEPMTEKLLHRKKLSDISELQRDSLAELMVTQPTNPAELFNEKPNVVAELKCMESNDVPEPYSKQPTVNAGLMLGNGASISNDTTDCNALPMEKRGALAHLSECEEQSFLDTVQELERLAQSTPSAVANGYSKPQSAAPAVDLVVFSAHSVPVQPSPVPQITTQNFGQPPDMSAATEPQSEVEVTLQSEAKLKPVSRKPFPHLPEPAHDELTAVMNEALDYLHQLDHPNAISAIYRGRICEDKQLDQTCKYTTSYKYHDCDKPLNEHIDSPKRVPERNHLYNYFVDSQSRNEAKLFDDVIEQNFHHGAHYNTHNENSRAMNYNEGSSERNLCISAYHNQLLNQSLYKRESLYIGEDHQNLQNYVSSPVYEIEHIQEHHAESYQYDKQSRREIPREHPREIYAESQSIGSINAPKIEQFDNESIAKASANHPTVPVKSERCPEPAVQISNKPPSQHLAVESGVHSSTGAYSGSYGGSETTFGVSSQQHTTMTPMYQQSGSAAAKPDDGGPFRGKGILQHLRDGPRVPVCEECQKEIRGPFVLADGKTWCPDHFRCATDTCRQPLLDVGFVEEAGRKHCERCFEAFLAPRCARCDAAVTGDCLNALNKKWHPSCFTCAHCSKPFGSSSFFLDDGKAYCEKDWNELFTTKCVSCHFRIETGDRWMEALGGAYHSNCFTCTICNKNLEGVTFLSKNGKPFCKAHA